MRFNPSQSTCTSQFCPDVETDLLLTEESTLLTLILIVGERSTPYKGKYTINPNPHSGGGKYTNNPNPHSGGDGSTPYRGKYTINPNPHSGGEIYSFARKVLY